MSGRFRSFEELTVWQLARKSRYRVYQVSEGWPRREMYGLTAQIRDAAISVTANVAEGYGRYHYGENIQLCRVSRGSLNEVLDHLYTALDEGYIEKPIFDQLYEQGRQVERVLNGYINYLKRQMNQAKSGKGSREEGEKGKREKVVKEGAALYDVVLDEFEWEGGVRWVYDYETGFDAGWTV